MTTQIYRICLTAILIFGWLFTGPSQAVGDPLVAAYEDIQQLNIDVNNLVYKDPTQDLIDIAEQKYEYAVYAKENKDNALQQYDSAIAAEGIALEELNLSQTAVDEQAAVVETSLIDKDYALQDKNTAQEELDIANINLQTAQITMQSAGNQGWQFTAYYLARGFGGYAIPDAAYCSGVLTQPYQGMPICGRYENMYVIYSGKITAPNGVDQISFAGYTDDGFRMYVDGELVISQWQDQGSTWSPFYYHTFTPEDRTIDVVFHYFNGGGPGVFHVGWGHSGMWTGVAPSAMSYGSGATQQQIDDYNQAVLEQQSAQKNYNEMLSIYNNKLSYYNQANSTLNTYNQTLTSKNTIYNTAISDTANALVAKQNSESEYDQSIIDLQNAINDARLSYEKRWQFEENQRVAAAIAQAIANQPKPEPTPITPTEPSPSPKPTEEPSPEPTSSPNPEQTKPEEPNPSPTPGTTDEVDPNLTPEPTPTPEPSPKPSPQPTDIGPSPTPEPKPTPVKPSEEPSQNNNSIKELVPENGKGTSEDLSRIIANLTSKDNTVVKLSPEQMAAVGQTLSALSTAAKVEVASSLGVKVDDVAILAEAAKGNPAVAAAIVSFEEKAAKNAEAAMPYTIADAITEAAAELFLEDPLAAFSSIDLEELSDPSQWGKDMTDDQREKAQEVVVPVILVSNIVSSVASALSIRRI